MAPRNVSVKTGWAQADITPDQSVLLAGQFHARVSEGIMDPVTATALAIESVDDGGSRGQVVMVSCDLATVSDELRDAVRARARSKLNALDPCRVFLGATHTHSAPDARLTPYGMESCGRDYREGVLSERHYSQNQASYGMWPWLQLDIMSPADYIEFAADRIADAIAEAWETRETSGISYGLGHAVVGRNRRLTYQDDTSQMYGKADIPEFRHVEGYEDHSVYAMMTYDRAKNLTGMLVNVPCPSQVSEQIYQISADYWHETRMELRKRFGKDIFILAQCAPAGDQSPHVLIGKRAEERMWRLKGRNMDENAPRAEIALRIADALSDIVPHAEREIEWSPEFAHRVETLNLPRRMISERDVEEALEEARPFRDQFEKLMDEIDRNPEIRKKPRWYTEVTKAYRRMERGERVKKRLELQKRDANLPIETHVVRIGDMAFATNPFELYLDYAVRIRERSKATQTFLIQKAGCSGTYLPSERSIGHKGYGSVPASTDVGPDGGDKLVDWTVDAINQMWLLQQKGSVMNNKDRRGALRIGWATRDITPDHPVVLGAQFHMRISEGVDGPVTATAMALSTSDAASDSVVFVSCDLGGFRHKWYDENNFLPLIREAIRARSSGIDVDKVVLNATHTHTSPNALIGRYGDAAPEGVLTAEEYMEFLRNAIADAVAEAWSKRKPGGVSWGLGTAVVGHNRRATYFAADSSRSAGAVVNGFTKMYGNTNDPNFSHIEGYEDHYVDLLYTWDHEENLTGVVVNLACPSQETEQAMQVSADFWHEVRAAIRKRHGEHIQVLAQCSAAGDQSPHRLWYKAAEERMLQLRGLTMREEIGRRVANAVDDVLPAARAAIQTNPPLTHVVKEIQLPRRMVTHDEAAAVRADLAKLEAEAEAGKNNYRVAIRCRRVLQRYEQQNASPVVPMQLHVIRLGDVAFAANRFELFLDYGIRIKARSPAVQTFVVQLTANDGWNGTYLPSERAAANQGYGGGVYDNEVGPDGGRVIVEETVRALNELWDQ